MNDMSNITYRRDYNLIPTVTSVVKEYESNSSMKSCGIENTYIINPRAISPHQFHLFSPIQNPRASQVVNTVWQKVTSSNDSHSIALLQSSTIHLKGSRTNESDEGLTLFWVRLPSAFKSSSMSNSTTRTTDLVQQIAAGSHVDSAIQFMNSTELEGPRMFRLSIETPSDRQGIERLCMENNPTVPGTIKIAYHTEPLNTSINSIQSSVYIPALDNVIAFPFEGSNQ